MHEQADLIRSLLIEGMIFTVTTVLTYATAYLISSLVHRMVMGSRSARRRQTQLPGAWLIFNLYVVGGLFYYGALPASPRALLFSTLLVAAVTVLFIGWTRLTGRGVPGAPAPRTMGMAGLLPWGGAWLVQLVSFWI